VTLRKRNGVTVCNILGFMPSIPLRLALLLGIFAVFSLLISLFLGEFNILLGGAIPFIILYLVMDLPSRALVEEVAGILAKELGQAGRPKGKPSRLWLIRASSIAALLVVAALALVKWPQPGPITIPNREPAGVEEILTPAETEPLGVQLFPAPPSPDAPIKGYSQIAKVTGRINFLNANLSVGKVIPRETIIVGFDSANLMDSLLEAETGLDILNLDKARIDAQESELRKLLEFR